jgi:hypothetical protein
MISVQTLPEGDPEAFVAWAIEQLRVGLASRPDRPHLIAEEDLRMKYLQPLVGHFERAGRVMLAINEEIVRQRRELGLLLEFRAPWDGRYAALKDALLLDYGGMRTLDDLRRFQSDLDRSAGAWTPRLLERFASPLEAAGLRAWWVGPMVLAAALRHVLMEPLYPEHLRRSSLVTLWPSGSRTVYTPVPSITLDLPYDPSSQSRASFKRRAESYLRTEMARIENQHLDEGHRRFLARNCERDAELTLLRLTNPRRWSWRRLEALSRAEQAHDAKSGVADTSGVSSLSGVRDAVEHVLERLEITPPQVRPGRPAGS